MGLFDRKNEKHKLFDSYSTNAKNRRYRNDKNTHAEKYKSFEAFWAAENEAFGSRSEALEHYQKVSSANKK